MALNVFELAGKIVIDHSKAVAAIAQVSKQATGLGNAFGQGERAAGKSLAQIAAENGKTVNQIRSEVMKVASAYQKQGMSASEAMRKAYADIGYSAERAHDQMDGNMRDSAIQAEGTANKITAAFKKIGAAVAAAFSVRVVVDFGKQCTEAYASIAAEESAFAQIMGDYADTAQAKLNAVADQTGITSTRLTGAMTSLTAKFKGLGYNTEDATTLATDGMLIAADAAAFWDMSLEESMSHLNSFINGSYEGGEAIGLFANDTQMAAYAIEQGIVKDAKAWAALDEATKQATRLSYAQNMMQQSGAVGQAAKESKQYANTLANLKESWRQFQGVIGKPILEKLVLPAMQRLLALMPSLTEAVQVGIDWLSAGFDKVASYFSEVFTEDGLNMEALPDALSDMFRDLGAAIPGLLRSLGRTIKGAWENGVWPAIQGLFSAVFGVELPSWDDVTRQISEGWTNVVYPAIQDFFKKGFGIDMPNWENLGAQIVNDWNTTLLPLIQDVGKITLALVEGDLQTAVDVARPWFQKILAMAGDDLKLTLGLLTFDTDENGKSWTDRVTEWVEKILPRSGALGVIISLLMNDTAENGESWSEKVLEWAKKQMPKAGVLGPVISLLTLDVDGDGVSWGESIKKWWDGILADVGEAYFTIKSFFQDPGDVVQQIKDWWKGILEKIDLKLTATWDGIVNFFTGGDGGGEGGEKDGSHGGNPLYQQRDIIRYNPSGVGGNNSLQGVLAAFAAQVESAAKAGSAAGVAEGMSGITVTGTITTGNVTLDSGVMVGQLAPRLDLKLGRMLGHA